MRARPLSLALVAAAAVAGAALPAATAGAATAAPTGSFVVTLGSGSPSAPTAGRAARPPQAARPPSASPAITVRRSIAQPLARPGLLSPRPRGFQTTSARRLPGRRRPGLSPPSEACIAVPPCEETGRWRTTG